MPLLLALLLALHSPPRTGEELVRLMHDRYAGKWYRTLTFVQTSTMVDGHQETWYEAGAIPGRLRIDIAPIPERNTILFSGDSVYQWQQGISRPGGSYVHPLLVLGFDLYAHRGERPPPHLGQLGDD